MFSVLVVEDNQALSSRCQSFLIEQGYNAVGASHIGEALDILESRHIDLLVCNTSIITSDAFTVIETVRSLDNELPIIALIDSSDFRSKQRAFNAGADDLMVKPVDLNELLLRLSALLRRARTASKQRVVIGNAVLDIASMTVVEGPVSTVLPPKEFMVLFKLCASPGRIFSRREIMDDVWGVQVKSNERTVDVHVKRLRERFAHSKSFRIETVRGVGYKAVELKSSADRL